MTVTKRSLELPASLSQIKPVMSARELNDFLKSEFPQVYSGNRGFAISAIKPLEIVLNMEPGPDDIRPGGTISGPTLFTLADLAAYVLILAHIGPVPLAVTTSLNINFLRKSEPGTLVATASFLKLGKRLAIVDIKIASSPGTDIVAQAVATYSIPPNKN
ncbi:MAG: PaaI family thioesterase [Rhizobiaceae bacterium]